MDFELIVHPYFKLLGFLGFFMDVWYPLVNWYMGGVRWDINPSSVCSEASQCLPQNSSSSDQSDPTNNAWKVALLLGAVIWSLSAATALKCIFTLDDSDDDDDTMVEIIAVHLVVATAGSVFVVIDNALADNLVFMLVTSLIRFFHLHCTLAYFRDVRRARRETAGYKQFLFSKSFFRGRYQYGESEDTSGEEEVGMDDLIAYLRLRRNARDAESS